jgi:hypothetical protein
MPRAPTRDASPFQTQPVDVRMCDRGHEHLARDLWIGDAGLNLYAIAREMPGDDSRCVDVLRWQNLLGMLDQRHARTQPRECLRQLTTGGTAANNEQFVRLRRELEDRFVREVWRVAKAGYRRDRRPAPGRDHCSPETKCGSLDVDRRRVGEGSRAEEHVDAEGLQSARRIVGREREAVRL